MRNREQGLFILNLSKVNIKLTERTNSSLVVVGSTALTALTITAIFTPIDVLKNTIQYSGSLRLSSAISLLYKDKGITTF